MRNTINIPFVVMICLCHFGCSIQSKSQGTPSRLDDGFWSFYSAEPGVEMEDIWRIEDDVLISNGFPLGYLYSMDQFDNFVLTLEWRWPPDKEPGKGGVLIRMTGERKIWPRSLEAQINAGDAGDFWGLDGYTLSGPNDRMRSLDHEQFGKLTNLRKTEALEKPAGQWNRYKIRAEGDTVTLTINGVEVNKATGCEAHKGHICLTSEGSEIHFRNIQLKLLSNQ